MRKLMLPLALAMLCLFGSLPSAFAQFQFARIQVIHNSPSPTVDVYLNGLLVEDDFAFRTATPYIDVPAGVPLSIGVALSTSTSVNDTIVNFPVTLTANETYTAIASGIVGDPTTPFILNLQTGSSETVATAGNVEFRVVHGSTDAPTVDVFARTVAKLVDDASYGDVTGYISVAPDQYYLDVTPGGDSTTIVGTFDANLSGLADSTLIVFASGFLAPGAGQPAFGLFAALPGGDVVELPSAPVARVQIIHNSPSPTVDIYAGADLFEDDFAFRTATEFRWVPAETVVPIGVALGTSTSANDTIVNFDVTFDNGKTYVVLASGIVGNATTPFTLNVNDMGREENSTGVDVEFSVVHGSPDAPAVDVFARRVAKLVDDAAYGDITNYIAVPAAQYYLDVTLANDSTTIAGTFNADLSSLGGGVATVFASGLLMPGMGEPAFGLFAALPDGTVVEFPSSPVARVQIIHNSPSPTVDIYAGADLFEDDFAFRTATEFRWVPAETVVPIGIALDNSASANDTIVNFDVTFENNKTYAVLASGIVGDPTTPFTLNVADMVREEGTNPANTDFIVAHGSPDAPAVDVFARTVAKLVDDAAYGDITDYISVPAAQYYLDVTLANDSTTIAGTFNADLNGLGGGAAVVFASGLLNPGAGEPGFGLFAALVDGTVVPFAAEPVARVQIIHNSPEPTVDIYLDGGILLDNLAFRDGTPFIFAPAEQAINIGVALDNSTSVDDTIANFTLNLVNGETYIVFASGIVGNANTPFTLLPYAGAREAAVDPLNIDVLVHHGSPDAPDVDVILENVGTVANDLAYTDFQGYVNPPAAPIRLLVGPESDSLNVVAAFDTDLTGLEGSAITVFASGNFDGTAPAFGLWAALADGTTFALDVTTSLDDLEFDQSLVSIYPNPVVDVANVVITADQPGNAHIRLYDLQGRLQVDRQQAVMQGENTTELVVDRLSAGTYTLVVEMGGVYSASKLVIGR